MNVQVSPANQVNTKSSLEAEDHFIVQSGVNTVRVPVNVALQPSVDFASRAEAVAALDEIPETQTRITWLDSSGVSVTVARSAGATDISDMPGCVPDGVGRMEHHGDAGAGSDDTAFATAALAASVTVKAIPGKTYIFGDLTITGARRTLDMTGCNFGRTQAAKHCVIVDGSSCSLIGGQCYTEAFFDANGKLNPDYFFVNDIVSIDGANTLTVTDASDADVGMFVFFETSGVLAGDPNPPWCPIEANIIESINGNQLTLTHPIQGTFVSGSKINGGHPAIKATGFRARVDTRVTRGIAGIQLGDHTAASQGNTGINCVPATQQCIGAGLIQSINSAAERVSQLDIAGANTVRITHTATAGQTVFAYDWNLSKWVHRIGSDPSLSVTVNGSAATIASIDGTAGTVTLDTPASAGDTVIVSNKEASARGILAAGLNGSASGQGNTVGGNVLGMWVGYELLGGTGGVEFGVYSGITFDSISHTGIHLHNSRFVTFVGCDVRFAAYPIVGSGTATGHKIAIGSTTVRPQASIYDTADLPNREHITLGPNCSNWVIPNEGRSCNGNYDIADFNTSGSITRPATVSGTFTVQFKDALGTLSTTTGTGYWEIWGTTVKIEANSITGIARGSMDAGQELRMVAPFAAKTESGRTWANGEAIFQNLLSVPSSAPTIKPRITTGSTDIDFACITQTGGVPTLDVGDLRADDTTALSNFSLTYDIDAS